MSGGMKRAERRDARLSGWQTVREAVQHPDHADVVGDLCRNLDTGQYQMLVYNDQIDNYERYAVPHKWAVQLCGS